MRFLARDDFFVFEPQLNATVQVIPHVGVEVGSGYRLSGATNALEDRLNRRQRQRRSAARVVAGNGRRV